MPADEDVAPINVMDSVNTEAPQKSKIWQVGTLSYTTGGLVCVCLWLLLGDIAWSMRDRSVGPMASWYLGQLNISSVLFGLLITSFPAAVALILSPVISVKSDRTRSRRGRRIPYLLVTTPLSALGIIGVGCTPVFAKWMHSCFPAQNEVLVSLICFGVAWSLFEFSSIASIAVFGGLINDVVPQHLLGRFSGLFRAVSLLGGIAFNFWIMGLTPTYFTTILVTVGVFYGVVFFLMCTKVKEGEYPPPETTDSGHNILINLGNETKRYCKECFSSRYYLLVFSLMVMGGLSMLPVNTYSIPYAEAMGVDMQTYGRALSLVFTISLCLAYFLGWLSDVFHPLRMVIISLIAYLAAMVYGSFFVKSEHTFLIAWVAHGVFSGCYFTTSASLAARLFPRTRFAQFASAAGILGSLLCMGLLPLMGVGIDVMGKGQGGYRLTFIFGALFSVLGLIFAALVHRRFMQLGGPRGYVAPEK